MKKQDNQATTDDVKGTTDLSSKNTSTTDVKKLENEGRQVEYGGRKDGLDPTRYGDWEKNGRCIDF